MADTFETIAARVMPYVQEAYAGTLLGYAPELGYGLPEYNAAAAVVRDRARRIQNTDTREDVAALAQLIAAQLIGTGWTPRGAGTEAFRRAWLVEAPSHTGQEEAPEVPTAPDVLTDYVNNRPALTDAQYATHNADMIGYALQSLPAAELAIVQAYSAVDAHQASRLPVAAIARHIIANAPHVCAELELTNGLPTGRRGVAFGALVIAALQMFADAYTDTLHHDTHDSRRRCSRPRPALYVLPLKVGAVLPYPVLSDTPAPLGYALQTGYATVTGRRLTTMDKDGMPRQTRAERRELQRATHAAFSDALGTSARPVPGVRPGVAYGNAIAGEGTAQRVQASRKRKRDGGIGSPMV